MIASIKKALGLDNDVLWVLINRISLILKGPLLIVFVAAFLSKEEQGVWYTFISLALASALAELGFALITTQFISHEFAHLRLHNGFIRGKQVFINRLFEFIKYSFKVYLVIVPVSIVLMLVIGIYVIGTDSHELLIAWILFALLSGANLFVNFLISCYQGLDKVQSTYQCRTLGVVSFSFSACVLIALGMGIWALLVATLISIVIMTYSLYRSTREFWHQLFRYKNAERIAFSAELIPLQLKYAISWISGYFIFNIFVPVTYKFVGAVEAGQLGLILTIVVQLSSISNTWLISKIPKFNILVSSGNKPELDALFMFGISRGIAVYWLGGIGLVLSVYICDYFGFPIAERVLHWSTISVILLASFAALLIDFQARYLRTHKAEPYYLLSLFNGTIVGLLVMLFLPSIGLDKLFLAILVINWAVLLPIAIYIFKTFSDSYYQNVEFK